MLRHTQIETGTHTHTQRHTDTQTRQTHRDTHRDTLFYARTHTHTHEFQSLLFSCVRIRGGSHTSSHLPVSITSPHLFEACQEVIPQLNSVIPILSIPS